MLSSDTLQFFADLLGQTTLSAAAPDFEVQAARVSVARRELQAAIEVTQSASEPTEVK